MARGEEARKLLGALSSKRLALLRTRGLLCMRIQAPLAPRSETFEWVPPPRAGLDLGDSSLAWFIDGSLFDEPFWFAKRLGFGIVVVHACGDLVACGRGRPPAWVSDAAGAELWAFFMVTKLTSWLPWTVTDCLGIL